MSEQELPIINVEGQRGDSIFYQFKTWCLPPETVIKLQVKLDSDLIHVKELNDDRLLVLIGALLVENSVDELLSAIMPGYKSLRDNRDFTFSMRIEIARALQLIPSRILSCADFIRKVRNEFAHNLSIDSFSELNPSYLSSLRGRLREFTKDQPEKSDAESFKGLVFLTALGIYGYNFHVEMLAKFLRDSSFIEALHAFCDRDTD